MKTVRVDLVGLSVVREMMQLLVAAREVIDSLSSEGWERLSDETKAEAAAIRGRIDRLGAGEPTAHADGG